MTDTAPERWRPPEGFIQHPCAEVGLSLWAPAPVAEIAAAPVTARCPSCGGIAAFDVAVGGLACRFCGHAAKSAAAIVGRDGEGHEFTLDALARATQGWVGHRREWRCGGCGSAMAVEDGALTRTCPFCASNQVDVRDGGHDGLRPRFVLPFRVRDAELSAKVNDWLGQGWIFPSSLRRAARVDQLVGVYVPLWLFSARADCRWRAQIGYTRTRTRTRDGKTVTETYTEWECRSGSASPAFHHWPGLGTAAISRVLFDRIRDADLDALAEYDTSLIAGWRAMAYDVPLPEAWEVGRRDLRERCKDTCYADAEQITGKVRSFQVSADFADESWKYSLFPLYVTAYRYRGQVYTVVANGQTGAIAGQKPMVLLRARPCHRGCRGCGARRRREVLKGGTDVDFPNSVLSGPH
jgi:hypothetical protein